MSKSIVKACVRYNDRLYTGFDHGECFKRLNEDNMIIVHSRIEQGFVDSDGNFVDRKQAMIIAKEAGQLRYEPSKKTLISEDLHLDWLNKQDQRIPELEEQLKNKQEELDFSININRNKKRLYNIWVKINKRCFNESCEEYKNYGGRGITIEEAEWYKEFGCIERTERLELLPYEEFIKVSSFTFESKDRTEMEMAIWYCDTENVNIKTIKITNLSDWNIRWFELPLTKENYIKACRKCKELFLGEKK